MSACLQNLGYLHDYVNIFLLLSRCLFNRAYLLCKIYKLMSRGRWRNLEAFSGCSDGSQALSGLVQGISELWVGYIGQRMSAFFRR